MNERIRTKSKGDLSKGMNHATRAASRSHEIPEDKPLTKEQWEAQRREEERQEREKLNKLRTDYNAYERSLRFSRPEPPCCQ